MTGSPQDGQVPSGYPHSPQNRWLAATDAPHCRHWSMAPPPTPGPTPPRTPPQSPTLMENNRTGPLSSSLPPVPPAEPPPSLAVLRLTDTLHHHLEQRPGRFGMLQGERAEDPSDEQQTAHLGLGGDVRRAAGVVDERHLAEVVTRAKSADGPSMDAHGRPPRHYDAE